MHLYNGRNCENSMECNEQPVQVQGTSDESSKKWCFLTYMSLEADGVLQYNINGGKRTLTVKIDQ